MRTLALILALLWLPAGQTAPVWLVTAEDWSRPRHGEALLRLPALSAAVRALIDHPSRQLLIRHPGGEEGVVWGNELRGWLVSLGVASSRMTLGPGSSRPDAIEIEVRDRPGAEPLPWKR